MTRNTHPQIDSALIAAIVREVIARLNKTPETVSNKRVIDAQTIEQLGTTNTEFWIAHGAIVTPAAKDAARRLGITITRSANETKPPAITPHQIIDNTKPERAAAVRHQLAQRGVPTGAGKVVLSDQPARDVHQHCLAGERAVMIVSIADVRRFADELNPTTWVLDMQRMNLAAAVNSAAMIARLGNTK
jgi:hypothetical protein